jgi:hypothetical protein
MSIKITCAKCNAAYSLRFEVAGKSITCACGETIEFPGPELAAALLTQDIADCVQTPEKASVTRTPVSPRDTLSPPEGRAIALVGASLLLIRPIVYGLSGIALWWLWGSTSTTLWWSVLVAVVLDAWTASTVKTAAQQEGTYASPVVTFWVKVNAVVFCVTAILAVSAAILSLR